MAIVWNSRNLPSYLGPSAAQLVFLFIFFMANSITLFALGVLLARNIWVVGSNVTTIEGWELERHETLLSRAKAQGGYLDGPDGMKLKITKQEFPYDIGIYRNAKQAMGSGFLLWLWPLTSTPPNATGLDFETNGFEDPGTLWPPPDPDRMPRPIPKVDGSNPFLYQAGASGFDVQAFRQRQRRDLLRYTADGPSVARQIPSEEANQDTGDDPAGQLQAASSRQYIRKSGLGWRNSDGDTLGDLGVDEEAEEDMPLAKIRVKLTSRH
ncbi:MAG: hypothetical protein Q9219_003685 [cf. Caloplaca sp. 3 TL-2023]